MWRRDSYFILVQYMGPRKTRPNLIKKASKIIVSPFGHRLLCRVYLVALAAEHDLLILISYRPQHCEPDILVRPLLIRGRMLYSAMVDTTVGIATYIREPEVNSGPWLSFGHRLQIN